MEFVQLGGIEVAFTRGGNRLCFVDPRNENQCIKVLRPDRTPEIRRREKAFPKNRRSLASFDENLEEFQVWRSIEEKIGEPAFKHISRCFGFVQTNLGRGLVMELIRDDDGRVAKTLKQYMWEGGYTPTLQRAVEEFGRFWVELGMPSKKLLLHNMLARKIKAEFQIYVIDGLGWTSLIPFSKYFSKLAQRQARKKIDELSITIAELLTKKQSGGNFGYHGWLDESQRAGTISG